MSVPQSSGVNPPRPSSRDDETLLAPSADDNAATIAEITQTPNSPALADQTLADPQESSAGTIAEANGNADPHATIAESTPSSISPESAVPTIIDLVSQEANATIPEIQATAGSSSAARAWAPTKGATGAAWPQPLPASAANSPTRQQSLNAPRAEDRYRLLDNFAHGGLGNIWRAEDKMIHRQIAFKELLPKALKNRVIVERFLEEAQITGQLEHPGIVPIYDVGYQENGTPFYAMKLLKGGNMEEAIDAMHKLPQGSTERQLAFTRLLRQFVAVCQAVGFAHDKGVLHRDLKPLNVMLGEFGETLVLDWGLAKVLDILGEQEIATDSGGQLDHADPNVSVDAATIAEAPVLAATVPAEKEGLTGAGATAASATSGGGTQTARTEAGTFFRRQVTTDARTAGSQTMMGQVMGTPAYMPPEQAQGAIDSLDARTDIYSLGAILYRLLTNRPPASRGRAQEVIVKVIAGDIPSPRDLDPTIPPPLEAICRKAMARQQADRYSKALDLATDVEAWLADEPVSVFREPWHERFRRWRKRHRTLVFSSSTAALLLVIGWGAWTWLESNRIGQLRLAAQSKVDDAREATKSAELAKATTLLTDALGQVRAESALTLLRDRIQSDLDNVARLQVAAERERIAELRTKANRLLDDARQATETAKDFAQARTLLTEAVTLLAKEISLAELHRQAQTELAQVNQTLAEQSEVLAAKALLAKFTATVEQVRVHGSNLSGEDAVDDSREAHKLGLAGLAMFDFDFEQPDKLDARLKLLGPEAIESWRDGMFELLFTVAQSEINLSVKDQPADVQQAAQRSLDRLRDAELLGRTSPAVASLKADLWDLLGQQDKSEAALQEMEATPARTRFDHFFLGELARTRHDYKAALSHYQDALQVDPDDYWSLNMIGFCHMHSQQPAAAAAAYTACIARRPDVFWPHLVRGYALSELQQFEQSRRDFDKALELAPNSYFVLLNRGFVRLKQKDFDAAEADFKKAAELRPDLSAPHENLADVNRRRGREHQSSNQPNGGVRATAEFQKSLAELTTAIPLSPQQGRLYYARGLLRVELSDPKSAFDDFQRAIKLEPSPIRRAACFREIARLHQRANRLPEALVAFDQSLAQNSRDTSVIRERADVLLDLNRNAEAIAGFTKFLELEGPVGDVYRGRASAYAKSNKYREAINDYTMSLQYEPSTNMLGRRGWAYLQKAATLAKEDFEEALRLDPLNPDNALGLAYAMVMLDDHAGAVAVLEQVAPIVRRAPSRAGAVTWPLFFNSATTYSQAYAKALVDSKLPAERRDELTKQYVSRAVEWLTAARRVADPQFRKEFLDALRTDEALNPIRQQPEFRDALKTIEAEPTLKP